MLAIIVSQYRTTSNKLDNHFERNVKETERSADEAPLDTLTVPHINRLSQLECGTSE